MNTYCQFDSFKIYKTNSSLPLVTLSRDDVPDAHVVVGGGGGELGPGPAPGERADRVDVRGDDLGDAAGEEVPDHDPPVVAAHREQRPEPVEAARHRHRDAVQGAIKLLRVVLPK